MKRILPAALALLALCAAAPMPVAAQIGPIAPEGGPRWLPSLGVRGGFDYRNSDPAVGALLRLPIPLPKVPLAVTPGGDLIFHDGLTDRQGMIDLTADLFGLSAGGGPLWLNSIYEDELDAARETRQGWTVVAGFHSRGTPFGVDLNFRWVFVEDLEQPRYITLAVTWTPGAPRRARGAFGF